MFQNGSLEKQNCSFMALMRNPPLGTYRVSLKEIKQEKHYRHLWKWKETDGTKELKDHEASILSWLCWHIRSWLLVCNVVSPNGQNTSVAVAEKEPARDISMSPLHQYTFALKYGLNVILICTYLCNITVTFGKNILLFLTLSTSCSNADFCSNTMTYG